MYIYGGSFIGERKPWTFGEAGHCFVQGEPLIP